MLISAGFDFVKLRDRSFVNGRAEVDLLFEDNGLTYSLWQVQCKNSSTAIGNDIIAREVGLAQSLSSNVVLVIATNEFNNNAIEYAQSINMTTNLSVILVSKSDIDKVVAGTCSSQKLIIEKSTEVKRLKQGLTYAFLKEI